MSQAEQMQQELAELHEQLQAMNSRYNELSLRLYQLSTASDRLCRDLVVMCEAQLAGDTDLVMRQVDRFTDAYRKNLKPADGRVH